MKLEGENSAAAHELDGNDGTANTAERPPVDPHSFAEQSLPTRLAILLAGVGMNALLAVVLFTGLAMAGYPSMTIHIGSFSQSIDPALATPSPARVAGLRGDTLDDKGAVTSSGDTILAVDGRRFVWFDGPEAMLDYVRSRVGQTVTLTIRRADGTEATVPVTLRDAAHAKTEGAMGIIINLITPGPAIQVGPLEAVGLGLSERSRRAPRSSPRSAPSSPTSAIPRSPGRSGSRRRSARPAPRARYPCRSCTSWRSCRPTWRSSTSCRSRRWTAGDRDLPPARRHRGHVGIRFERRAALVGFALLLALVFWVGANDIARIGKG